MKDCMKKHTASGAQGKRLRESCDAGCQIKDHL